MLSFINSFCYCISFTESSQFGFKIMSILLIPAEENNRHWFLFLSLEIVIVSSDYLRNNPGHRLEFCIGQEIWCPWPWLYNAKGLQAEMLSQVPAMLGSSQLCQQRDLPSAESMSEQSVLLSTLFCNTDVLSQRNELRPCHNIQVHLCWMVGSPSVHHETMLWTRTHLISTNFWNFYVSKICFHRIQMWEWMYV